MAISYNQHNEPFIRTCQECGYEQPAKDPSTYKNDTKENWRDLKCRKCKSEALDYGSYKSSNPFPDMDDE